MSKHLPIIALIILIASFCVVVPISYAGTITATLNQFTSTTTIVTGTVTFTNTAPNEGNLDNSTYIGTSGIILIVTGFVSVLYIIFGAMIIFGNIGETKLAAIFSALAASLIALLNHLIGVYFLITYGALFVFAILKNRAR